MCWCTPEIRTPNCGKIGCHPPARYDEGFKDGYTQAVHDYGIWKDGQQTIGCLETPVKEVLAKKFPTGSQPEEKK